MKNVAIIGSTGSIGTQTLEIVRVQEDLNIVALAAGSNIELLEKQAREFSPEVVGIWSEENAARLRECLADTDIRVVAGMDGLIEIAELSSSDILVTAIVGMIGIRPTIAAINAGKDIALANKETLVTAGHIIMPLAAQRKVPILPVVSEHSAIFQCLQGCRDRSEIKRLILTCSGGPFYGLSLQELATKTKADALKHPNWTMGAKITIDSATLMNKGLELIEAVWLFGLPPEKIQIVVQRQSIVHSAVQYSDNSIIAQLGVPDMRIPIQYALTYPARVPGVVPELDFTTLKLLTFDVADEETFRCLAACKKAIKKGGLGPCAANGANEEAVRLFLEDKIGFLDIGRLVEAVVDSDSFGGSYSLADVYECDRMARAFVRAHL